MRPGYGNNSAGGLRRRLVSVGELHEESPLKPDMENLINEQIIPDPPDHANSYQSLVTYDKKTKEKKIDTFACLDEYQRDKYSLATVDGLANRSRDLTTLHTRINNLMAWGTRCKKCTCDFDSRNYTGGGYMDAANIPHTLNWNALSPERQKEIAEKESHPLTFYLNPHAHVPCRLCRDCLRCQNPDPNRKKEVCTVKIRETTPWEIYRIIARFIWRCVTLWGSIVKAYNFATERMEVAVGILAVTLILNMDEKISLWSPGTNGTFAANIWIWFKSALVLFCIIVALKILGVIEWINFTAATPTIQRLKRQRFKDIYKLKASYDRYTSSYEDLYWSDNTEEGGNDPDIADANLSQPPETNVVERCVRRTFLCRCRCPCTRRK